MSASNGVGSRGRNVNFCLGLVARSFVEWALNSPTWKIMTGKILIALGIASTLQFVSAQSPEQPRQQPPQMQKPDLEKAYPWMGKIERLDPGIDKLLAPHATIE